MIRRWLMIAFTAILLTGLSVLLTYRVQTWKQFGWVGMELQPLARNVARLAIGEALHFGEHGSVALLQPGGPAENAGFQLEDQVVEINQIPLKDTRRLMVFAQKVQVGDLLRYKIKRNDQELKLELRPQMPLRDRIFASYFLISVLIVLIYLLLAVFVFWKKPSELQATAFYGMSVVAALYFFKGILLPPDTMDALGLHQMLLSQIRNQAHLNSFLLLTVFSILLFHFALLFPKERPFHKRHPYFFRLCYLALPMIAAMPYAGLSSMNMIIGYFVILLVIFASCSIATCVCLFRSYRESGLEEKRQVKWPLWATLLAIAGQFVFPLLLAFILFLFHLPLQSAVSAFLLKMLWKVLYLIIPISFVFAILKYRLMEIDVIIKKTILYSLYTAFVLLAYALLVAGLGGLLMKTTGVRSEWITIFSTLLIAGIFVPVRRRAQDFLDRRFFRKRDYSTALRNLTRDLLSSSSAQSLAQVAAEQIQQAIYCRNAVVFLRRESVLQCMGKVGISDEIREWTISIDEQDLSKLPQNLHSVLLVPIGWKEESVGLISLGSKLSDEAYLQADKDFLAAAADQISIGLQQIRARAQDQEYEKAREIQEALLPKNIPQLSGFEISGCWQPARAVGGDYFDVVKVGESQLAICIADVVGKGLPAALLMSNLQAMVRSFAPDGLPPNELCRKVNRVLCNHMGAGKYITFFYCLLDADLRSLLFCNAGHNPPIRLDSNGAITRLEEGGPVLGVFPEADFRQQQVDLFPADRILFYTDGITEVNNSAEEEFSEERLIHLLLQNQKLCAGELQSIVMGTVRTFSNGIFQDDATLISIAVL